jgi:hypothetical protein
MEAIFSITIRHASNLMMRALKIIWFFSGFFVDITPSICYPETTSCATFRRWPTAQNPSRG